MIKPSNRHIILAVIICLITAFYFSLPSQLFNDPSSTVLLDKDGELLSAKIAKDEQWRFPESDSIPLKFKQCILHFEDEYFYNHFGFNPISFSKALWTNIKHSSIKRGGSTITMQTIRLSRKGQSRTIIEKIIEIILATRIEISYSKNEILNLYSSHAPFGGNVVGLEAASWRYYGRPSHLLSWAESATLAVLPNAPSLIFPGKNHKLLELKRNRLLDKLLKKNIIDSVTCDLSKLEGLPQKPFPLPRYATHLLERTVKEGTSNHILKTTIDKELQVKCKSIIQKHQKLLEANHIYNAAIFVMEVESGNIISYIGNTEKTNENHGQDVDIIKSNRSTGSLLKPLLYAECLKDGTLLPEMLVDDIPTQISGYSPKNYNKTYDGVVPAKRVIARSLNIPSVKLLQGYKYERFHFDLQNMGMTTLNKSADHYGLSLILGGCEGKLEEMCGIYASLARSLNHYNDSSSRYFKEDIRMPKYINNSETELDKTNLDAASIWLMFNTMKDVHRPYQQQGWEYFNSSQNVGWKTGTSFGNRDGWAIGVTPKYVVGVWVGNADGEGRPELTGINSAAPILFDVFGNLPRSNWFDAPYDALHKIAICKESGHRPSSVCNNIDSVWVQEAGLNTKTCPYHKLIHLDEKSEYQVNSNCYPVEKMKHKAWFILPPIQEWYYKSKSSSYMILPDFKEECREIENNMDLIYPKSLTQLYVPKEIDGAKGKVIFEVAHRKPNAIIYWHLDGDYIGYTNSFHKMPLQPEPGKHSLTIVDDSGQTLTKSFIVFI